MVPELGTWTMVPELGTWTMVPELGTWTWYTFLFGMRFCLIWLIPVVWMYENVGCLVTTHIDWALVSEPGFLKFQIFRFSILEIFFWNLFSKNMLVSYRGINNKGVLERPWTKWRVLRVISGTLKCQFTGKCWRVDFLTPCTTKSAETLQVAPYGRCGPPGNP